MRRSGARSAGALRAGLAVGGAGVGVNGRDLLEWLGRKRNAIALAVLAMLAAVVLSPLLQRPTPPPIVLQSPSGPDAEVGVGRPSSPTPTALLVVHVVGEVATPGVYNMPAGSRIDDALRAAGGATPEGDLERVNLAARVADGQQIRVPRKGDNRTPTGSGGITPARININAATVAELETLRGVGTVTAQRIVAYREQHGPFLSVEELREARLVSAAAFEEIKDLVTV